MSDAIKDFYDSLAEVLGRMTGTRRSIEKEITIGYEEFIGAAMKALYALNAELPNVQDHHGIFVVTLPSGRQVVVDTTSSLGTLVMEARKWAAKFEEARKS